MNDERRPLVTERVVLEPIEPRHADALWQAKEASLDELRRWMAWAEQGRESHDGFVHAAHERWGEGEWVFAVTVDALPIGTIGVDRYQPMFSSAEVGYWLRSDMSGRGLMTEAAAAVVEYSFAELGIHRLELRAGVENYPSLRVAEKLGFRRGGLLRHASRNAWAYYDVYVFDLLATDERTVVRRGLVEQTNDRRLYVTVNLPSSVAERRGTRPRNA
jgi:ribosomal-protein-serine acetyltransferase